MSLAPGTRLGRYEVLDPTGFIVHRDLEPENIFLTADGRVKVQIGTIRGLLSPAARELT